MIWRVGFLDSFKLMTYWDKWHDMFWMSFGFRRVRVYLSHCSRVYHAPVLRFHVILVTTLCPPAPHHYHHHPFHRPVKWYHTVQLTQSHSSHCSFYPAPPGTAVAGAETPPENLAENAAMPSGDTLQPDYRLVSSVFSASQSGRMPWDFPQALTGSMLWVKPWSRGDNQRRIMTWWFRL